MNASFALRNFCSKSVKETFCDEDPNSFRAFLYVLRMHSEDLGGSNPTRSPGCWYRSSHCIVIERAVLFTKANLQEQVLHQPLIWGLLDTYWLEWLWTSSLDLLYFSIWRKGHRYAWAKPGQDWAWQHSVIVEGGSLRLGPSIGRHWQLRAVEGGGVTIFSALAAGDCLCSRGHFSHGHVCSPGQFQGVTNN